jgi:hypothetical protein
MVIYLFTVKEVTKKVEDIKVEANFYLQLSNWIALIMKQVEWRLDSHSFE